MADSIKIGNLDVTSFKVGNTDVDAIYLGDTLLYSGGTPPTPTIKDYFRLVPTEGITQFKFSGNSIDYSLDSGSTWTTLAANSYSPPVDVGEYIMFKATNLTINNGIGCFSSNGGKFNAEGNVMSLEYGDNFETATTITSTRVGVFRSLFDSCTEIINASGLTIPSTNVPQDGYRSMFYKCVNLVTAPTIFPATTLSESCYKNAFSGCTNLATVPELPATNLAASCYANMFRACKALTVTPVLSATTLQQQCYEYMFRDCIKLTTAPELPAQRLANQSYRGMFYNCSKLNYIKCMATDIHEYNCTNTWVQGVAPSGTFVTPRTTSWRTGTSGIPNNWSRVDA